MRPGGGKGLRPRRSVPEKFATNVEVAHVTQGSGEEAQVPLVALGPLGQSLLVELERGPQTPGGDAHVVQLLGVLTEADGGLVGKHGGEVAAQEREGDLVGRHGAGYLPRPEIWGDPRGPAR